MDAAAIRQKLHNYLEVADDRKLEAIYVMVENELEDTEVEYSEAFKQELDRRVDYYLQGGQMVSPEEMNQRIGELRKKNK